MRDFGTLINKVVSEETAILSPNNAILYALSLGLGTNDEHLQFVYEKKSLRTSGYGYGSSLSWFLDIRAKIWI